MLGVRHARPEESAREEAGEPRAGPSPSREEPARVPEGLAREGAERAEGLPPHCTRARYVTKPPGAKAGVVEASRGRVLTVRPDVSVATPRYSPVPGDEST
jgi:hypothetical protein